MHDILSRSSILHSGQENGFPRKSWVSHVTLCGGWRFKAVPPCDPIQQVTRKTCTEQRAIPDPESDLILDRLFVLHLLSHCRPMRGWARRIEARFCRMPYCFPLRLRIGACQSRHPHLRMGEFLREGSEIQLWFPVHKGTDRTIER